MRKRRRRSPASRFFRRLLPVVCTIAACAAAGYIGFAFWVNTQGEIAVEPEQTQSDDPVQVTGANRREHVFTLLVAATDEEGERTDSILVATFDMANKTCDVMNVPRDTLVDTARTGAGKKINAAYGEGVEQLKRELESVLGYAPDKYMVLHFDGIAQIVDSIGGIDYEIPMDMSYHDKSQDLSIEFQQGMQHLDGQQVVEFLRWRHNDDGTGYENGDIGRVEKLQTFLKTLAGQILTPGNVAKLPDMVSTLLSNVDTDLTAAQLVWLGTQGAEFSTDDVQMQTLIGDSCKISFGQSYYLWYYVADEPMVLDQINSGLNPFVTDLTELGIVTPDSVAGAQSPDWLENKRFRYNRDGLEWEQDAHGEPPAEENEDYATYDDGGNFVEPAS